MPAHFQETIDERISKAVCDLAKIVQSGNDNEKLPFNSLASYGDLKKILSDRFLTNKDFLAMKVSQLTQINFPMMPAGLPAAAGAPMNFGLLPAGFSIATAAPV